jgi:hypothetical protein
MYAVVEVEKKKLDVNVPLKREPTIALDEWQIRSCWSCTTKWTWSSHLVVMAPSFG